MNSCQERLPEDRDSCLSKTHVGFCLTPQSDIFSESFLKMCNLETRIFINEVMARRL